MSLATAGAVGTSVDGAGAFGASAGAEDSTGFDSGAGAGLGVEVAKTSVLALSVILAPNKEPTYLQ